MTEAQIRGALEDVIDPHFNVSLTAMGMVRRVETHDDGRVEVGIVYPCIGCPAWDLIQHDIRSRVSALPGVSRVRVKVDWEASWDRSDMSTEARAFAREHGYAI